jgi:exodeoxyribonuclease VII large subunit
MGYMGSREPLLPGWDAPADTTSTQATPGSGVTAPVAPPGTFGLKILGVSEVARAIREAVRSDPRLTDVWVEGEVGRVTVSSAGHAYFSLKDDRSALACVWFRDERVRSAFQPQAGLRIVVHGRVDLFEQQGAVQLYVESIQPAGFGDLALRFEALKARLAQEGLFDSARKRPLPSRPTTIAVITSPTGVVWRDIATVLSRRWPLTRVLLVACQVQGEEAPASIVAAFRRLERWLAAGKAEGRADELPQLTILARGGGSLEDLWSFNDERVVRAVVAHTLPVVCGVGHEVDVTLADFAADVRAPTPSAAAEMVVPDRADWLAAFRRAADRTAAAVGRTLEAARRELAAERRALDRLDPRAQLASDRERVGLLLDRAVRAADTGMGRRRAILDTVAETIARPVIARIGSARATLDATRSALAVLDPQSTLDRGYAIVRRTIDGAIVRDTADAPAGTPLAIRVARGELPATVDRS